MVIQHIKHFTDGTAWQISLIRYKRNQHDWLKRSTKPWQAVRTHCCTSLLTCSVLCTTIWTKTVYWSDIKICQITTWRATCCADPFLKKAPESCLDDSYMTKIVRLTWCCKEVVSDGQQYCMWDTCCCRRSASQCSFCKLGEERKSTKNAFQTSLSHAHKHF